MRCGRPARNPTPDSGLRYAASTRTPVEHKGWLFYTMQLQLNTWERQSTVIIWFNWDQCYIKSSLKKTFKSSRNRYTFRCRRNRGWVLVQLVQRHRMHGYHLLWIVPGLWWRLIIITIIISIFRNTKIDDRSMAASSCVSCSEGDKTAEGSGGQCWWKRDIAATRCKLR